MSAGVKRRPLVSPDMKFKMTSPAIFNGDVVDNELAYVVIAVNHDAITNKKCSLHQTHSGLGRASRHISDISILDPKVSSPI
jgi:hypothetical protein